jgi:hypothetical protein
MEYCKFTRERDQRGRKGRAAREREGEDGASRCDSRRSFSSLGSRRWRAGGGVVVSWSLHAAAPVTQ